MSGYPTGSRSRRWRLDINDLQGSAEWQIVGRQGDGARLAGFLIGEDEVERMPVGERDRLLAQVYEELFGRRILASRRCGHCDEPYDLDFVLADVVAAVAATPQPPEVHRVRDDGRAELASGHVLSAPTHADENAVADLTLEDAEAELLERCIDRSSAHGPLDPETAAAVLEWLSPVVDLDLLGTCPECGVAETTRFSLEHYLVRALAQERTQLLREVHLLAATYGWSRGAVLELARRDRRHLAALVEAERNAWRLGSRT
ncbi:MAG: hypothetical protein EA406_01245 [Rhodospirillales bacterium]|nr:MAG: hypothetical protein EA406_01245 [Rhodospirillales bacterium]